MSCCDGSSSEEMEAKTRRRKRKRRGSNSGPRVKVTIKGKSFYAHKKKGSKKNIEKLKKTNPKLYYRSQATKQIAKEMKDNGEKVNIMSETFKKRVGQRAKELMSG